MAGIRCAHPRRGNLDLNCIVGLHLEHPWWLLLILLAIPFGWIGVRSFHAMSRLRVGSAVLLRSALIALIALMLAGASAVQTSERLATILLVDVSGSVKQFGRVDSDPKGRSAPPDEAIRSWLARALTDHQRDDLLGVVLFDGEAFALLAPSRVGLRPGENGEAAGDSDDGAEDSSAGLAIEDLSLDYSIAQGTNIAEAIRFASALAPPGAMRRLVLVSDGVSTGGDALSAAREVTGGVSAVPIDVLPISYNVQRETIVEFVDAPPRAARGSTVTIRVGLRATVQTQGTLRLTREGRELDINGRAPGMGRRLAFGPGRHVELIEVKAPSDVVHRFEAHFEPDDPSQDMVASNNRAGAMMVTPGRSTALIVDGVSDGDPTGAGAVLADALGRAEMDVRTIAPEQAPTDLIALQAYDLIVLQNVAADEVPRVAAERLATYVRELGGGLVMIGGSKSFGAGAWNGTPVETVMPVEMDLPEKLVVPSAAIMIVLDSSGSMSRPVLGGSRSQQEIANRSAAMAIKTLDKQDLVGVIAFSNTHRVIVPLEANENPERTAQRVLAIGPGGGTNLYPALAEAGRMLQNVEARVKHVIVLSDGQSMGSPQHGERIAANLASEGITVSTIAVGDQADVQTLGAIAARGQGQHYRVIDPNTLPRIFIKEIRVVRKPLIREGRFAPVLTGSGSPMTAGLPTPLPPLLGMTLTQPRSEPTVITAMRAPAGEPLLAHWNVGLGRTAAWTSDAHDWASAWVDWPGYETMWTQVARVIGRPPTSQRYDLSTEIVDGQLRVRLEIFDDQGEPVDLLSVPGWAHTPEGHRRELRLNQTGPGVYEATAPAESSGNYVVALTPRQGTRALSPVIGGASHAGGPEYRRLRSDVATLRRIADVTGGRVLDWSSAESARLFERAGLEPRRAETPLWPTLLIWTLVVLLLDVGTRRVAWDRLFSRELAIEVRRHASQAIRGQGDQAATTLGRLRGRRAQQALSRASGSPSSRASGAIFSDRARSGDRASEPIVGVSAEASARRENPSVGGEQAESEDQSDGQSPSSSLLAAKRRAWERYQTGQASEEGEE